MTRIAIFISLTMICFGCKEEEADSEIKISEFILSNYLDDSKDLYMREIAANPNHPNYTVAELDTVEITRIITALQLIYAMDTPESDSVFELYEIHAQKGLSFNSLSVKVNPNLPEIVNLANEVIPTGNAALDALLNTYKFNDVSKAYNYPTSPYLVLNSQKDYNLIPVANQFRALTDVFLSVENNGYLNFLEDDIVLSREGEDLTFDFRSVSLHTFKFNVHHNVPEFIGH